METKTDRWVLVCVALFVLGACNEMWGIDDPHPKDEGTGGAGGETWGSSGGGTTASSSSTSTSGGSGSSSASSGSSGSNSSSTSSSSTGGSSSSSGAGSSSSSSGGGVCSPGATESCYSGVPQTDGVGACHAGMRTCLPNGLGFGPCEGEQVPDVEVCDAAKLDEDCDGQTNEEGCFCGDGIISAGEECDDGNVDDTDACPNDCKPRVLQVVGGYDHTCVLVSGGIVKCWGGQNAAKGQLGQGNVAPLGCTAETMGAGLPTVNLGTGKRAVKIAAGGSHNCALLADGSVKCWGANDKGELGLGDVNHRGDQPNEMGDNLPTVNLGVGKTAIDVACGWQHTCAILNDLSLKCWGLNLTGELGLGDGLNRGDGPGEMGDALPVVNLGTGKKAVAIAPGGSHTCAILEDSTVKCWGNSNYLGLGTSNSRGDQANEMGDALPAVDLGTGKLATQIVVGLYHSCAIITGNAVKCWGSSGSGQLGLGDTKHRGVLPGDMGDNLSAVEFGTGLSVQSLSAGGSHTCARLSNGSLKCWGSNYYGQLGLGDIQDRGDGPMEMGDALAPVNLGTGASVKQLGVAYLHTCMVLGNDRVKCWGNNGYCQVGLPGGVSYGNAMGEMGDNLSYIKIFSDSW